MQIATPEGVTLELVLAGVGSRTAAAAVDLLVILFGTAIAGGAIAVAFLLLGWSENVLIAVEVIVAFLIFFGYDVFCEVGRRGRTVGKQLNGLRVVRDDGGPVVFTSSAIRNLIRIVEVYALTPLVAMTSIFVSARNQRLGDLAAGTLVIRERVGDKPARESAFSVRPRLPVDVDPVRWDVAGLTRDEVVAAGAFLDRRLVLTWDARRRLGGLLAGSMRPKVPVDASQLDDETFLQAVVEAREART